MILKVGRSLVLVTLWTNLILKEIEKVTKKTKGPIIMNLILT